jgi:hypothetical protein
MSRDGSEFINDVSEGDNNGRNSWLSRVFGRSRRGWIEAEEKRRKKN